MEGVCIPFFPPPGPPAAEGTASNVMMLPTREALWFSSLPPPALPAALFWNPDSPVMDEAALGTSSLFSVMGTVVAGGLSPASLVPKEDSRDDIGSMRRLAATVREEYVLSIEAVGAGDGGGTVAGCALSDGAIMECTALSDSWGTGAVEDMNVGTNSLAVARIIPVGLVSTYDAGAGGFLAADGSSGAISLDLTLCGTTGPPLPLLD